MLFLEKFDHCKVFCFFLSLAALSAYGADESFIRRPALAANGEAQIIKAPNIPESDLSAEVTASIKNDLIYIRVSVVDNVQASADGASVCMYKGDSVQLAFHSAEDEAIRRNRRITSEIGASLIPETTNRTQLHKWYGPLKLKRIKCKAKRIGNETIYDFQIPIDSLGFKVNDSEVLFSVLVNDNDGGVIKYIEWSGGIAGVKSPAKFGHLTLNDEGVCVAGYSKLTLPGEKLKLEFKGKGEYCVKISDLTERDKVLFDGNVRFPGTVKINYSVLKGGLNHILISVSKNRHEIYRARRTVVALDLPGLKTKMSEAKEYLTKLTHTRGNYNLLNYYLNLFDKIMESGEYIRYQGALREIAAKTEDIMSGKINAPDSIDLTKAEPPREILLKYGKGRGYGHQGLTSNGKQWFIFHTDKIFRYEKPDFTVNQENVKRNMKALDCPKLKELVINHLGAPEYYNGIIYTFGKAYSVKNKKIVYLFGFDAESLVFKPETMHSLKMPEMEGGYYNTGGGPVIRDGFFYCVIGFIDQGKKKQEPRDKLAKFKFPSGEFVEFIQLKGGTYEKAQGLFMDEAGNYYIPETHTGIKMFDSNGNFRRYIFKTGNSNNGAKDIHEGLFFDPESAELAFSMTSRVRANGGGDYAVQVNLKKDKFRFVDGRFGENKNNLGYNFADSKKNINMGIKTTVPGVTLLISGYTKTNPARETIRSFFKGEKEYPVTWLGYPEAFYITGSNDFSPGAPGLRWVKSSAKDEYYLCDSRGKAEVSVKVFAACPKSVWKKEGIEGVAIKKEGKSGSLDYGEWGWGNVDGLNFNTLYCRPEKGQGMDSLHIEGGQRDNLIILDKPFNVCRNVKVFLPNSKTKSGIAVSSKDSSAEKAK